MKPINICACLVFLFMYSCDGEDNEYKTSFDENSELCDTLPEFAIFLIEANDSVNGDFKNKKKRSFSYRYPKGENISTHSFPFLNTFHSELNIDAIKEQVDSSLADAIETNFNESKNDKSFTCSGALTIVNSKTINVCKQLYESNRLERLPVYYSISYPLLFDYEGIKYLIVELDEHSYGSGYGDTFIFSMIDDKWVLMHKVFRWLS